MLILLLTGNLAKSLQNFIVQQTTALAQGQERIEKAVREEMAQARRESASAAMMAREEMSGRFDALQQTTREKLDSQRLEQKSAWEDIGFTLAASIRAQSAQDGERFQGFATEMKDTLSNHYRNTADRIEFGADVQKRVLDSFSQQLGDMTRLTEQKLEQVRATVEAKLTSMQSDNSTKLEQMRATVDEKLHQTLETRLGESFKLVSDRLELVQKGLGEMQNLASGVGDLKKVLMNVKTRGTLGEIQLENILEQTLSADQYQSQAQLIPHSPERVDFAVVLPGRDDETADRVFLPIDAKFPLEDYHRLVEAEAAGDGVGAAESQKMLEARIRTEAKSIQEKYIKPPRTTDFALLFLPIEGLYAEVLRRPGLWESLQRDYRVIVAGPTTITALLNSLQMGFRTLAIQKRSSEVWKVLGAVKADFGKFGEMLEKTQKKLQEASNTIETASKRSRTIERKLRSVESLPEAEAQTTLQTADTVDAQAVEP